MNLATMCVNKRTARIFTLPTESPKHALFTHDLRGALFRECLLWRTILVL